MRICHIVPSLEDRHGGPSRSVRALANAQAVLGDPIELLATTEADQVHSTPEPDSASLRYFPRVAPRWLSRSPQLRRYLCDHRFDVLHNHALWLLPLHYAQEASHRQRVPLVISPRGMMSGWAWRHRRWRKHLAELFVHPGAFAAAAGWHATSPEEADDIRALGFKHPVCVSPNGVTLPSEADLITARNAWQQIYPQSKDHPIALFYSRFHRKKRIKELISLWLAQPRGNWRLLIAGVAEDYTTAELTAIVAAAGAAEQITVFDGADRPPPYAVASLFILPSHSENFGLVIAEALAAGVPALVTDTTPWSRLAEHAAGWCVSWDHFARSLATALATQPAELAAMGRRGRAWVERDFAWDKAARLLQQFYQQLLTR
jgi:glycosyltransferase involved in cell wall biosynthesis